MVIFIINFLFKIKYFDYKVDIVKELCYYDYVLF